eukprot:s762_g17.t2
MWEEEMKESKQNERRKKWAGYSLPRRWAERLAAWACPSCEPIGPTPPSGPGLPRPGDGLVSIVLVTLVDSGAEPLAASTGGTRQFFEQAVRSEHRPAPDPREVAAALKVQSRISVQKAMRLLKTLDKALFQVNTFHSNAILSGCHNWEESLELLKEFKCSSCADAVSYNCVMNSLKWPITLALVGNLETLNNNTNNNAKDPQDLTISYNRLISSCKTQDAWKHSLRFLLMMKMEELKPDQFSYMAALDVLQKSKLCLWRRSCHILSSMPAGLVQPDIFSWNSMLASVPDSNWKTDMHLLNSMQSMRLFAPVPDLVTYHTALRGEDWRIVLFVLTLTAKQQLQVNAVTLNSVLGSFTTPAWARATLMLDDMASNGILPDVLSFNSYLHTCASSPSCASCSSGWSNGIWLDALRSYERLGLKTDSFSVASAIKVRSQAARSAFEVFDIYSGWQEGLTVLQTAKAAGHRKLTISSNVVLKECSEVSDWQAALVLFGIESDEFSLSTVISACEKAFQWPQALFLLHTMPAKDIVCFGAAASACEKGKQWQLALCLLSEMSDCILQPNLFTFNAVISACGHAREWARALSLLELLGSEADVVSYNAALSAFERASMWQTAVQLFARMKVADVTPDSISFNAVLTACENGRKWEQVLALLADDSTAGGAQLFALCNDSFKETDGSYEGKGPAAQITWRLAKMAQLAMFDIAPQNLTRAWRRAAIAADANISDLADLSDLATCLWSMAVLNVQDDAFLLEATRKLRRLLALGHHKRLPMNVLGNLLWALGSLMGSRKPCVVFHESGFGEKLFEIYDVYHTLQQEILRRTERCEHTAVAEHTESSASILLQSLWASAFGRQLPTSILAGIKSAVLHLADNLDQPRTEGQRTSKVTSEVTSHVAQQPTDEPDDEPEMMSEESEDSEGPKSSSLSSSLSRVKLSSPEIVKALQHKLVVLKPTGWQVDDSEVPDVDSKRQSLLSCFLRSVLPPSQQLLLDDLKHRRGFLHRLDIPTSGLILVATTYQAYYDLQLQLVSGAMTRDYAVLCHGWSCPTRIEANVHWLEDGPAWLSGSRVLLYGKPAVTLLETVASYHTHHTAPLASSLAGPSETCGYGTADSNENRDYRDYSSYNQDGAERAEAEGSSSFASSASSCSSDARAVSFVKIHIVTGRCHQIRLHTAHVGHPVITDAKYASAATFQEDRLWCPRNFLHRYRLEFSTDSSWTSQTKVEEPLPSDLKLVLARLDPAKGRRKSEKSVSR